MFMSDSAQNLKEKKEQAEKLSKHLKEYVEIIDKIIQQNTKKDDNSSKQTID